MAEVDRLIDAGTKAPPFHPDAIAREVLPESIKVNQGFIGQFLAGGIGHWFGFATHKGVYEAIGSADTKGQLHESSKCTVCAKVRRVGHDSG